MSGSICLAWRYVCHHRGTTAILITAITLVAYLPAALEVIVNNAERHFRSRSVSTPLVVGPRGSQLELVLASLYFDKPYEAFLSMEDLKGIEDQEMGQEIPLHLRYATRDCPIVGTTAHYFPLRDLRIARGDLWNMLGECVIGAHAAERLNVQIGSRLPVSATSAFVLDSPPLRLRVVGILAPSETPDDEAIFVHLRTSWIMEGLGHGHVTGSKHGSPEAALYTDITQENAESFHFHGEETDFPISAIVVVPGSTKNETLLLGQYLSSDNTAQITQPQKVIDSLLAKVVMVHSYMIALIAVVTLVTLLTIALVIALSIRLRREEVTTISKMGCSRGAIASMLASQLLIILTVSAVVATALTLLTDAYGRLLVRMLIL